MENIGLIIKLRDGFMHYKPTAVGEPLDKKLEEKLKTKAKSKDGFKPSLIVMPRNPDGTKYNGAFFPERCMSHSCAAWAVTSSLEFINGFYRSVGGENPFTEFEAKGDFKTDVE